MLYHICIHPPHTLVLLGQDFLGPQTSLPKFTSSHSPAAVISEKALLEELGLMLFKEKLVVSMNSSNFVSKYQQRSVFSSSLAKCDCLLHSVFIRTGFSLSYNIPIFSLLSLTLKIEGI